MFGVMLIFGIWAVVFTPSFPTRAGTRMPKAERILTSQITLARQLALTKNRSVEVRFIRYGDPEFPGEKKDTPSSGAFRAIQVVEVLDSGAVIPLAKLQVLPETMIMSGGDPSTLVSSSDLSINQRSRRASKEITKDTAGKPTGGDPSLPRKIELDYEFVSFRFLQDGSTDLKALDGLKWCVTIHNINERVTGTTLPPNFVTLQIDPVSGAIRIYRPSV
jgi:uncharacterized protein (TIGR02596 family)